MTRVGVATPDARSGPRSRAGPSIPKRPHLSPQRGLDPSPSRQGGPHKPRGRRSERAEDARRSSHAGAPQFRSTSAFCGGRGTESHVRGAEPTFARRDARLGPDAALPLRDVVPEAGVGVDLVAAPLEGRFRFGDAILGGQRGWRYGHDPRPLHGVRHPEKLRTERKCRLLLAVARRRERTRSAAGCPPAGTIRRLRPRTGSPRFRRRGRAKGSRTGSDGGSFPGAARAEIVPPLPAVRRCGRCP
jgi:hypothetical protein